MAQGVDRAGLEAAAYWKAKYQRERNRVYDLRRRRDFWRARARAWQHESLLALKRKSRGE